MSESIAWLPPINSHDNFSITIEIKIDNDSESCSFVNHENQELPIKVRAVVEFWPENNDQFSNPFTCLNLISSPQIPSNTSFHSAISYILENKSLVPFEIPYEYVQCEEFLNSENNFHMTCDKRKVLIEHIAHYLYESLNNCASSDLVRVQQHAQLVITKSIMLPEEEYNSWGSWWYEQSTLRPKDFEKEFDKAISRPRTEREMLEEATMRSFYRSTDESSIDALEEVVMLDGYKQCTMCLEELLVVNGVGIVKMPCSHEFHKSCIVRWLKTSHMCPLCRYSLPTT